MHTRAIITGWRFSPTLQCQIATSTVDTGIPYGTNPFENEKVVNHINDMEKRGLCVTIETRDAG